MSAILHFLSLLLLHDKSFLGCVTVFFASPVKCVNDTTVLRRGKHAVGTARSWGQTSLALRENGAPGVRLTLRGLKKRLLKTGASPLSEQAEFPLS
jgi:hypothetical protein